LVRLTGESSCRTARSPGRIGDIERRDHAADHPEPGYSR
jgi:hypothetical protein